MELSEKVAVRARMRALRRALAPDEHASRDAAILRNLVARADIQSAIARRRTFCLYLATPAEIGLAPLCERLWAADAPVCVPCWDAAAKLYFPARHARNGRLAAGPCGIPEPAAPVAVAPEEIGVWIVPGLAFTHAGDRLGYGGGWYDRMLAHVAPDALRLGVAYDFQIVAELPRETFDIRLDGVVTDW